jgi:hypothetical protein
MSHTHPSIVIAFLLLSGLAFAQDLPDAPSAAAGNFAPAKFESRPVMTGASAAAIAPRINPDVLDAAYWTTTSALVSTTVVNVELTTRCAEQRTCLTSIAPGSTRVKLYAYTLPTDALLSYATYKLKARTRWWPLSDLIFTAANVFNAGRSFGRAELPSLNVRQSGSHRH